MIIANLVKKSIIKGTSISNSLVTTAKKRKTMATANKWITTICINLQKQRKQTKGKTQS